MKPSKDQITRNDTIEIRFREQYGRAPAELSVEAHVEALPHPRFEMVAALDDSAGNSDGVLELGEKIELVVGIKNIGEGVSSAPMVALKNMSGEALFITRGRARLDELAPGAQAVARLAFDVRAVPEGSAEMLLSVGDQDLGSATSQQLQLQVQAQGASRSAATGWASAPAVAPIRLAASSTAPVVAQLGASNAAKVTARVGDYYRIELVDGFPGFVSAEAVKLHRTKRAPRKTRPPEVSHLIRPPLVSIAPSLAGLRVDTDKIEISGTITSAAALRDVFIFANNNKVYFSTPSAPAGASVPFQATVPLEEGPNYISVIGRVDEELRGRDSVVIHRHGGEIDIARPSQGTP
jgi:carboxyl-terminal processing protease